MNKEMNKLCKVCTWTWTSDVCQDCIHFLQDRFEKSPCYNFRGSEATTKLQDVIKELEKRDDEIYNDPEVIARAHELSRKNLGSASKVIGKT